MRKNKDTNIMDLKNYHPKITHKELQQWIADLARLKGYKVQFWWRSFHSGKGFLDLVCARVKDDRVCFIEVKIPPDKLSTEQQEWYDTWSKIPTTEVRVFEPKDWLDGTVEKFLD